MSRSSMQQAFGPMELQNVKRDFRSNREPVQKVSSNAGKLVDRAIQRAEMTREQAAGEFGISASLLARQIQNVDNQHLSLQRLWSESVCERFKRELVIAMAEDAGMEVETTIRLRRIA